MAGFVSGKEGFYQILIRVKCGATDPKSLPSIGAVVLSSGCTPFIDAQSSPLPQKQTQPHSPLQGSANINNLHVKLIMFERRCPYVNRRSWPGQGNIGLEHLYSC